MIKADSFNSLEIVMNEKIAKEIEKHAAAISAWAQEHRLIEPDHEIQISYKIKKIRTKIEIVVKRWKLNDDEWRTIFALPWTDFQRAVLQIHRDGNGRILKSTSVPGRFYGRSLQQNNSSPSYGSYLTMNRSFAMAKLPFRFLDRYNQRLQVKQVSIAKCTFSP